MSDEVTAIVPVARTALSFDEVVRLGTFIARSGLFGMKTPEQAIALMMIAHAEGRHPALAARDYDIIQGRPTKKAEAMLRDFLDAGGKVQWHSLSDEIADATFSHSQGGAARISWDMARVQKAGLRGKDMYAKFPRQMLRSRCVSEGVRTIWPSATGGMYVPEEAAHIDAHIDGEVTEPVIVDTPPPKPSEAATDPLEVRSLAQWRTNLRAALGAAQTLAEVEAISGHRRVLDALNTAPEPIRVEVEKALAEAHERFHQETHETNWPDDAMGALLNEIAGMDLVRLDTLRTDAQWRARVRDAATIPSDEDLITETIANRRTELQGKQ